MFGKCMYHASCMGRSRYISTAAVLFGLSAGTCCSSLIGNGKQEIRIGRIGYSYSYCSRNTNGDWKAFTPEEVQEMNGVDGKPLWVTYRGEVYDVTKFKSIHPGGFMIEQAGGSDVEPFWRKWAAHFHSNAVKSILNENKIGVLSICHLYNDSEYSLEPSRESQRLYHDFCCLTPASSQTHPGVLKRHFLTPNEALYIRNHAPVPKLTAQSHLVTFSLLVDESRKQIKSLSFDNIKEKYGVVNIISVLQCAGNRQNDDFLTKGTNGFTGTPFEGLKSGMVGNVLWTGVRLDSLLRSIFPAQCDEEDVRPGSWHVVFTGADEFESSTPLNLVLQGATDGLLAYRMNGESLLPDHGYPVRVILPGIVGARNVKWLESVTLSKHPSNAPWNQYYYRNYKGEHIQKLPMNSIIFSPDKASTIQLNKDGKGSVSVEGVAYSGGNDSPVRRVELTSDGGKSWTNARLLTEERNCVSDDSVGDHSWVRFVAEVPVAVLPSNTVEHSITIHSRVVDSSGLVQPETSGDQRTYLYHGWGTTTVRAVMPSALS